MLLFLEQLFALASQPLALVTKLHGGEMLFSGEDKAASQKQTTEKQQRETVEGPCVTVMMNPVIALSRGNSFHVGNLSQISDLRFEISDSASQTETEIGISDLSARA